MIDSVTRLLTEPLSITVGTVSVDLRPMFLRAYGITIVADRVTVYAPRVMAGATLANLEHRKAIAVTIGSMATFECAQLKGDVESVVDAGPEANLPIEENTARVKAMMTINIGPEHAAIWGRRITHPAVAITFVAREVFNQTPGAGAGAKL